MPSAARAQPSADDDLVVSEDLLLYAQLGHADHIGKLIDEGADPDWRRADGITTLMMAAMTNRVQVIEALLDHGATIDLRAPDGLTALLAACAGARTTRETSAIELLLARGANPNLANDEGNDALMLCSRHGLVEAVIALLRAGADPRRANRFGTTALMQAARGHLVETARVLVRAGADRSDVDERGLSAARYARELGQPPLELAAMLVPSELGSSRELSRGTSKFDEEHFEMSLMGAWSETSEPGGVFELTETTGERQIQVAVSLLPAELDRSEQEEALARSVGENQAFLAAEAAGRGATCIFSEVRFAEATNGLQARFSATSGPSSYCAMCVYATPLVLVTLTYRDFRPNLSEETRARQASESVGTFRVK